MSNTPDPVARCPLCRAPAAHEHRPFCTRLCRDRDLLNWLHEDYRVPGRPQDEDDAPSA